MEEATTALLESVEGERAAEAAEAAMADGQRVPPLLIYLVFVVSGVSALLYQLIWQRALLTIYGTNIESVTVVVSAFMVGLGIGSLAGGAISKDPRRPLLLLFGLIEVAIGVYGWFSLSLFELVGLHTAGSATLETGIYSFCLVLLPTLLMGSTLPLLVAHQVNRSGDVGRSVGILYFVNTLGGALGAFAAALFALRWLGLAGSIRLAVGLNLLVGVVVLVAWLWTRRER